MSRPRHHIVPQMLSKRFKGSDGLWFYDSRDPSRGVHRRKPDSIFWVRGFYSLVGEDGVESNTVEEEIARIESGVSLMIDHICNVVRDGGIPTFDRHAREVLATFVFQLFKRPAERRSDHMTESKILSGLEEAISSHRDSLIADGTSAGVIPSEEELASRIIQNVRTTVVVDPGTEIIARMSQTGLYCIRSPAGRSFILGSNPVARCGGELGDERAGIVLPISPEIAICWGPRSNDEKIHKANAISIRGFNDTIWGQSHAICGNSEALIRSMTQRHLKAWGQANKKCRSG